MTSTLASPVPGGVIAVREVELTTLTVVAGVPPTETWSPALKFSPWTEMDVPPPAGPKWPFTELTYGPTYLKRSAGVGALVEVAVSTVTSRPFPPPKVSGTGEVAVICVGEFTLNEVPASPNFTPVAVLETGAMNGHRSAAAEGPARGVQTGDYRRRATDMYPRRDGRHAGRIDEKQHVGAGRSDVLRRRPQPDPRRSRGEGKVDGPLGHVDGMRLCGRRHEHGRADGIWGPDVEMAAPRDSAGRRRDRWDADP